MRTQLPPGQRFHTPGAKLRHPSLNFGCPLRLDFGAGRFFAFEAFEEKPRELRTVLGRHLRSAVVEVTNCRIHARILRAVVALPVRPTALSLTVQPIRSVRREWR